MKGKITLASLAATLIMALAFGAYLYTHPPMHRLPSDPDRVDNITFFALGDQGDGGMGQWAVSRAMEAQAEKLGKIDFVTLLGDNFYTDEELTLNSIEWQSKFENVYSGKYLTGVPFYAVLGNNDPATVNGRNVEIDYSLQQLGSNRWRMPANYYAYDFGISDGRPLVRIVFLDTNLHDQIKQQADFIREKFAPGEHAPVWKIVVAHHPVRTYGKHHGEDAKKLAPIATALQQAEVDLYLAGHDHNQQVIAKDHEPTYVINGGGGAHTYAMRSTSPELKFARIGHGFASVHVDAHQLDISLFDTMPKAVASYTIARTCHESTPRCLQLLPQ